MSFAEEMTHLGNECIRSFNDRVNFLGKNMAETRNFLNHLRNSRKMMSRKLHNDLHNFTEHLSETVGSLREHCRKHQRNLHQEFKKGHFAFEKMGKMMQAKRHNFFGTLKEKARQEFNHPPRPRPKRRKPRH